jgi:hypothetical protein
MKKFSIMLQLRGEGISNAFCTTEAAFTATQAEASQRLADFRSRIQSILVSHRGKALEGVVCYDRTTGAAVLDGEVTAEEVIIPPDVIARCIIGYQLIQH